jgi:excisionase family DNA binding protein
MNDQTAEFVDIQADGPTMTLIEVAKYLNVHPITIYRLVKTHVHLGQFKVGRLWRFGRDDIRRFASGSAAEQ